MPIIKSAIKRMRQAEKRRQHNAIYRKKYKSAVKETRELVGEKKKEEAGKKLIVATKALDKAAKKNIIHKNKASRLKSNLSKAIKTLK